jgi:hypothetical protein
VSEFASSRDVAGHLLGYFWLGKSSESREMSDEICIPPRRGIPRLGLTRRDSTQYLVKVRCSRGAARQTRDLGWRDPRCPSSPWRSERVWRDDTDHADGIATEMRPQNNPEAVRSPVPLFPCEGRLVRRGREGACG